MGKTIAQMMAEDDELLRRSFVHATRPRGPLSMEGANELCRRMEEGVVETRSHHEVQASFHEARARDEQAAREQSIVKLIRKACPYCRKGWPIEPDEDTDGVERKMRYHTQESQSTPGVFGGGYVECCAADERLALGITPYALGLSQGRKVRTKPGEERPGCHK